MKLPQTSRTKISEVKTILHAIEGIKKHTNEYWINSLDERKLKELEFHNRDKDKNFASKAKEDNDTYKKFYGNKKFYGITKRSKEFVHSWIKRECNDKIFLDYACGNGSNAITAAENGARLSLGLDISDISVKNAEVVANAKGLSKNTSFFQADAENTLLPDNSIDRIICSGMLHHLDLSYAMPELRRILKPNGKILAIEALDYNPFIKLYRMMTPDMRTEWEKNHILSFNDINFIQRFLTVNYVNYFHVVGYAGAIAKPFATLFESMDLLLEKIPYINRMAWMFIFELEKKNNI